MSEHLMNVLARIRVALTSLLTKAWRNFEDAMQALPTTSEPLPPPMTPLASSPITAENSPVGLSAPVASSSATHSDAMPPPPASTTTVAAALSSNSPENTMSLKLTTIATALSLLPNLFTVVDQAVQSVEASLSGVPGISGSAKLQAAEQKVNSLLASAGADVAAITGVSSIVTPLINEAVSIFNAVGLFKKSTVVAAGAQGSGQSAAASS